MARTNPHDESAQFHLVTHVPTTNAVATVGEILKQLRHGHFRLNENVYIISNDRSLVGVVKTADLLEHEHNVEVSTLAQKLPFVYSDADQESVASHAVRHHLSAVPIVDRSHQFLGVVPAHALISILRQEHVEDIHRIAGILKDSAQATDAMDAQPLRRALDRLPWLLVGLGGSVLATFIMTRFEHELAKRITVSFFVPAIVYLADAIGTQSEAIAIRGLSLSHQPFGRILLREFLTGVLIGSALAGPILIMIGLAYDDWTLGSAVALSVVVAGTLATTIGIGLPGLLARLGLDPAFGSGPLATIIQDVLSLLVYFLIVQLMIF